jgi:DNA-binding IclR family transcriptional regulator
VEKPERKPISKTLRALSWLAESSTPEVGVRQLAAAMNIAPSSAHRILLALSEAGFVRRDGRTQRYALGNEFLRLSHLAITKAPLRQAGAEAMRRLVENCDESALLGIYDDGRQEMIYAASVDSKHSSQRVIQLNKWIPVRTGASGLAILAFLKEAEACSIVQRLALLAPGGGGGAGRADPEGLATELATVRRQGYAFTRCQWIAGAVGLAAPIFGSHGKVLGDVCLTIPAQRLGDGSKDRLVDALRCCVSEITKTIGSTAPSLAVG